MLKYTVYLCKSQSDTMCKNVLYNLYKHNLGGDFYLATFRYLDDLKKFLTLLDVSDGEVYFSNVLKKER